MPGLHGKHKHQPAIDQHAVAHLSALGFSPGSIAKRCKVPVTEIHRLFTSPDYQQAEARAEDELAHQINGRHWRLAFQTLSAVERLLNSRDRAYVSAGIRFALDILNTFDPSQHQSSRRRMSVDEARRSTHDLMASLRNDGHRDRSIGE
jgi:hypothetical protein